MDSCSIWNQKMTFTAGNLRFDWIAVRRADACRLKRAKVSWFTFNQTFYFKFLRIWSQLLQCSHLVKLNKNLIFIKLLLKSHCFEQTFIFNQHRTNKLLYFMHYWLEHPFFRNKERSYGHKMILKKGKSRVGGWWKELTLVYRWRRGDSDKLSL